jgi:hypothetical protein
MTIPYAGATSGMKARDEITKTLQRFGCESVGFMDDFTEGSILLAFKHRGRQVQLRASAKGWATMSLKEKPWSSARKSSRLQWEQAALAQGLIAVNSILRDWVKGQVTAVETGILSFEQVFMPHMLTDNGQTLVERVSTLNLLPPPQ